MPRGQAFDEAHPATAQGRVPTRVRSFGCAAGGGFGRFLVRPAAAGGQAPARRGGDGPGSRGSGCGGSGAAAGAARSGAETPPPRESAASAGCRGPKKQVRLITADLLGPQPLGGSPEVAGEVPGRTQAAASRARGAVAALEILEHLLASMGHGETSFLRDPTLPRAAQCRRMNVHAKRLPSGFVPIAFALSTSRPSPASSSPKG